MNKFLKSALAVCAIVPCALTFGACGDKTPHQHTYAQEWSTSETHHWRESTCGHDDRTDYGTHRYENQSDTECEVCSRERIVYSVWNGEMPTSKPNTLAYDMDNRYIYLNDASAFVYFAWQFDMNDEYEARTEQIETARDQDMLDMVLVRDESDVTGENCFKTKEDWTVMLNANIDLDNHEFSPIQNFSYRGFEGQGHIIKNFIISNSEDSETGLFGKLVATENTVGFNDLILEKATIITTNSKPAGIIGESEIEINNVHANDVEVIGVGQFVGAICGKASANVVNCSVSNADVTGVEYAGGIVGYVYVDEGAGAIELDNLYVENSRINNTEISNKNKLGAVVGGVERISTKKLDSLTITKTNTYNNVGLYNSGSETSVTLLGLNVNYSCIVR